ALCLFVLESDSRFRWKLKCFHLNRSGSKRAGCRSASAFGAKLEGLVERLVLRRELADHFAALRVGRNVSRRFAPLRALVDIEHGVVDEIVLGRLDDDGLGAAVARGPDTAGLRLSGLSGCRAGRSAGIFGGAGGERGRFHRLVFALAGSGG